VALVARIPARVQTKLLAAFLTIVGLLIILGAVGLRVLSGVNDQTEELIKQQRKIAAYRQVQHDTTNQLYGISTALLFPDDRTLDAALRQLNQFGYDLDRLAFVAKDEVELIGQFREDYNRFIAVMTQVVELIRGGKVAEARKIQFEQAGPLADRLERRTTSWSTGPRPTWWLPSKRPSRPTARRNSPSSASRSAAFCWRSASVTSSHGR